MLRFLNIKTDYLPVFLVDRLASIFNYLFTKRFLNINELSACQTLWLRCMVWSKK